MYFKTIKIAHFLFIIGATLFVTGCGDSKSDERGFEDEVFSPLTPPSFSFQNPSCVSTDENFSTLKSALFFLKTSEGFRAENRPVKKYQLKKISGRFGKSTQTLASPSVEKTLFQTKYDQFCSLPREADDINGRDCLDSSGQRVKTFEYDLRSSSGIVPCVSALSYSRESAMSAAVNSLVYIEQASQRLDASINVKLRKIKTLEIFPLYRRLFPKKEIQASNPIGDNADWEAFYSTHNLAYWPNRDVISVYPENSVIYERHRNNFNFLWESPFPATHEFFHHYENSFFGHSTLCGKDFSWNGRQHSWVSNQEPGTQLFQQHLCTAFSESIADLMTYYSLDKQGHSLQSLFAVGMDREVNQKTFSNGTLKQISNEYWDRYYSLNQSFSSVSNANKIYKDPHMLGAIFAHSIRELIRVSIDEQFDTQRNLSLDSMMVFHQLIKSIDKRNFGQQSFGKNTIEEIILEIERFFIKYIDQNNPSDLASIRTKYLCQEINEHFPVYKERSSCSE